MAIAGPRARRKEGPGSERGGLSHALLSFLHHRKVPLLWVAGLRNPQPKREEGTSQPACLFPQAVALLPPGFVEFACGPVFGPTHRK